jgi:3-oxoacyl-[acyl-carrier protein] reductase
MIPIDLTGHTALVTGSTGELGRVITETLARAGADLILHYNRSAAAAEKLQARIASHGVSVMTVQADITDKDAVTAMRRTVEAELRAPDILVNNAVIQYEWTTVMEQSVEDYESQFRSCVLQNVLMAQEFVPSMQAAGWGRIIAMNTECSMQYWSKQSAYISGKRGMDGVLRVLAREIGEHNITVNQVAPGFTLTDNHPDLDSFTWYKEGVPLKRRGTAQEIANVVAFLASDLASFITGAYIPACGGNVMPAI